MRTILSQINNGLINNKVSNIKQNLIPEIGAMVALTERLSVIVTNDTNTNKHHNNMGLFDFLKPKKSSLDDNLSQLLNSFFPNGETDINAGTDELLLILNNKIERKEARNIFVKSVSMSRIAEKFDKERLINHLRGYCLHHFNDQQIEKFLQYLNTLTMAMGIHGSPPSKVERKGEGYAWY